MSRNLVSLLALVPMLIHSILGCCWHHEHHGECGPVSAYCAADRSQEESHHHSQAHADCGSQHSHDESSLADDKPAPPCPQHPCDEGQCIIITTNVSFLSQSLFQIIHWPAAFISAVEVPCQELAFSIRRDGEDADSLLLPSMQRRALSQVWVI